MENLNVQSLALMLLVTMAYAAPVHNDTITLLKEIEEEAGKLLNNTTLHNISVPKIPTGENGKLCVPHYFCCAEKSIHTVPGNTTKHLYKLLRNFNKEEKVHNCQLNTFVQYRLRDLLTGIQTCAQHKRSKRTG